MHRIRINNFEAEIPGKWNELTADQLLFVCKTMASNVQKTTFDVAVLRYFSDFNLPLILKLNQYQLADIAESISFLHQESELTKQLLPILEIGKNKLLGPADAIVDLTFEQFYAFSEPAFVAYMQTGDEAMLDMLIASLYKKKRIFDDADFEEIADLAKKIDKATRLAVLLFYVGSRNLLIYKFPNVFATNKNKKSRNINVNADSFFKLLDSLNNEDLSNNERIKKANLYEAMTRISAMIERSKKLKKT